jgi:hypothetical protein
VTDRDNLGQATARVLDHDEVESVVSTGVYHRGTASSVDRGLDEKPSHYKVICISMYLDDLKRLDTMVDALKARGLTKANRSALIRYALNGVKLEDVPKGL